MKDIKKSEKEIQNTLAPKPKSGINEISAATKVGRHLRILLYAASLATVCLTINACKSKSYVETEPTYVEYNRPPQPSTRYIWINGDWQYNPQNHVYVQKSGYWAKSSPRRTHFTGHWETSPQGSYWVSSHYERNRR